MAKAVEVERAYRLNLPEELIIMLLNEQTGYFHQVPGWELNCAVVGAVLAELSIRSRIDTDMDSLILVDGTETGNPVLDSILEQIADESQPRTAQYWIERLAVQAESIIDSTLERLVNLKILKYYDGDFWMLIPTKFYVDLDGNAEERNVGQLIKARISEVIFTDSIPGPRDAIVVSLVDTCDVFRFIYELDERAENRIKFICKVDLIGRSIANAVKHNIASPLLRRSRLAKEIPSVAMSRLLFSPHLRQGHLPALFADLNKQYGPVFAIRVPFKAPMLFVSGPRINRWVHRHGRLHLRARDYFVDFEKVYGASGVLPSLDGSDHFRLRRAMSPAFSRARLEGQLDQVFHHAREFMSEWTIGDALPARQTCRRMINAQMSPLALSVDSQDLIDDLIKYKERALNVHIAKALPKFLLSTPAMIRRATTVDALLKRVESVHTPAQRSGCPRDIADDWLSLHTSDPQLMPESNLRFVLSAALVASVYLGDALSFAVYAMASQPAMYERIRSEADALFGEGDPEGSAFTPETMSVTVRFLMECLRMYPIVPMAMRDVMNSCVVEGYELPVGSRIYIAQTASHYMEDVFPEPYTFDIDRYLPPRNEQRSPGYAPYGLGTHRCLGSRWMDLQLAINVLMIAHYFRLEVSPANYALRFSPLPSLKPSGNLKFLVAERQRKLPV